LDLLTPPLLFLSMERLEREIVFSSLLVLFDIRCCSGDLRPGVSLCYVIEGQTSTSLFIYRYEKSITFQEASVADSVSSDLSADMIGNLVKLRSQDQDPFRGTWNLSILMTVTDLLRCTLALNCIRNMPSDQTPESDSDSLKPIV